MARNTPVVLGFALGSALIAAPIVWADGGGSCQGGRGHMVSHHHGGHGHGSGTSRLLRHLLKDKQELGLTDEQVTKLRKSALDVDRARIRAEADVRVSERELRSLMWDDKAEMAAIEAKVKEEESLEATVRIIGIKGKRELLGMLTPEQKNKWKALWEERRSQYRSHTRAEADDSGSAVGGEGAGLDRSGLELSELDEALSAG